MKMNKMNQKIINWLKIKMRITMKIMKKYQMKIMKSKNLL